MCTTCGCGSGETRIGALGGGRPAGGAHPRPGATRTWRAVGGHAATPPRGLSPDTSSSSPVTAADTTPTSHPAAPGHHHLDFGSGPAHAHAPGLSQAQMVKIERDILGKNDARAAENRAWLAERGIFALNLVSSPGSGKTSLLVRTLQLLGGRVPAAVIEGDQQTEFDAERIRATGVPALQINTGKGCHLDADMVARALPRMELAADSLLLIENVGNLVCPAAFDLGEAHKVAIFSVTEGEDKPLKYPDMFAAADLMLLNKTDLLPYLAFDTERAIDFALRVNPRLRVIRTSATTGEGLDEWIAWIEAGLAAARARRAAGLRA
ncbi:MAG: hydrogenase nickel incorporation protein HypB [Proteobacteria bacterium]|nr:hydrogenase nickel incorporation protein HypB [Pseudomonadota bacterium]